MIAGSLIFGSARSRRHWRTVPIWLLLWLGVSTPISAEIESGALALLDNMATALRTRTYRGTFVQVKDNHVESFRIEHSYDDLNGERERMLQLNGEIRQIFRDRNEVTCIWPGSESVVVSDSKQRDLAPQVDKQLLDDRAYTIRIGQPDRIADRNCAVVEIQPNDNFRFGSRLWIDEETGLLLRRTLLDEAGKVVDELMFVDIQYPDRIEDSVFEPVTPASESYRKIELRSNADSAAKGTSGSSRISFSSLPDGYVKIQEIHNDQPFNNTALTHAIVSDGLASVSVYVQYGEDKHTYGEQISRMGALTALEFGMDSAAVTLVGEVPLVTLRELGKTLQLSD